ncbi:hypothetical protein [Brevundimonas subvibrioides]|uniref:hypothetical protein n=1 Tax=Brevundimonas subvibrioides TaxID=74313 RepID=UPI0022B2B144|nr:hypothetical protein [Brevundimonas subvibrioides]
MFRFRIEEIDGQPIIRLTPRDLDALGGDVGDVIVLDRSGWQVQRTTNEIEHQIEAGKEFMELHKGVLSALAKT